MTQMLDGRYRLDGRNVTPPEASREAVDEARIPPGLHFVVDLGVCLRSNGLPVLCAVGGNPAGTVYAEHLILEHPPGRRRSTRSRAVDDPCEFIALDEIGPLVHAHDYIFIRCRAEELEMGGF